MFAFIVSVLGVNTLTQFYKNALAKYGDTKIHVAIAVLSIAAGAIVVSFGQTVTYQHILAYAGSVFATAVMLYKLVWSNLGSSGIPKITDDNLPPPATT